MRSVTPCPYCKRTAVVHCVNSRPPVSERNPLVIRRRSYECTACGGRFGTEEKLVDVDFGHLTKMRNAAADGKAVAPCTPQEGEET